MFMKYFASFCLLPIILAAPSVKELLIDTSSHCGQWDTVAAGQYTLLNDQWGRANASSGFECASITSQASSSISWKTNWNWQGGKGIKGYTNIQLNSGLNKQLFSINSISTIWKWSQTQSGDLVANVAYDLFLSSSSGGRTENEIMIWAANFNAGPISFNYNADGSPRQAASSILLAGLRWNLYLGSNNSNKVFSFLPTSGAHLTNFNADLNVFLKYLTANGYVSNSQFLTAVGAGTETTLGTATLTTSSYSIAIN